MKKTNDVTYRQVSHCMGAWKWGWPHGERIAIVRYVHGQLKDGTPVWKSAGMVCDGLTAVNVGHWEKVCPEAFQHSQGSIHNERI